MHALPYSMMLWHSRTSILSYATSLILIQSPRLSDGVFAPVRAGERVCSRVHLSRRSNEIASPPLARCHRIYCNALCHVAQDLTYSAPSWHAVAQTLSPTGSNVSNLPRTVVAQQTCRERALCTTRFYSGHVYGVSRLLMCVPRVLMSATKRCARPGV
jgi:hypothetical protein